MHVYSYIYMQSMSLCLKETTAIMRQQRDVWTKGMSAGEEILA